VRSIDRNTIASSFSIYYRQIMDTKLYSEIRAIHFDVPRKCVKEEKKIKSNVKDFKSQLNLCRSQYNHILIETLSLLVQCQLDKLTL
jgi:hypothetical protein